MFVRERIAKGGAASRANLTFPLYAGGIKMKKKKKKLKTFQPDPVWESRSLGTTATAGAKLLLHQLLRP